MVAGAKLGAFVVTQSSALLAESLHSFADSANEVLLLVGARRAARPADLRHPFGHARYRYVYAFLVSLTVFWIGGVLAVVEGVLHLASNEPIVDPLWAFAVLALGAVLDGWSLRTTVRAGRASKGVLSWKQLVRTTKAPELIVVFLEDLGALIGIAIATVGVGLATITGAAHLGCDRVDCHRRPADGNRTGRQPRDPEPPARRIGDAERCRTRSVPPSAATPGISASSTSGRSTSVPTTWSIAAGIVVDGSHRRCGDRAGHRRRRGPRSGGGHIPNGDYLEPVIGQLADA